MTSYLIRRIIALIPLLLGVSILVFLIIHLIPGNPVAMLLGPNATSHSEVVALTNELGLNQPLPVQYWKWLINVLQGNLGYSFTQNQAVTNLIAQMLPYTLTLSVCGLVVAIVIGVSFGVVAAIRQGTVIDTLALFSANLGIAIPSFWLGLLLILIFGVVLKWVPVVSSPNGTGLILPSITLGWGAAGLITRMVRSSLIEALQEDYIRTARAKGLHYGRVLIKHGLRNALLPTLVVVGLQFGSLLAGSVVVEVIFSRPGIGRLLIQAILSKDYALVQGLVLIIASMYAVVNLIVDIGYSIVDPRIKLR
ncbi:ABC transporter permease [Alicyclobacillus mengziensis]|uniref:ABC transporter permease n=1 Tax=Alicyclobacillus mengziensis TaxID=2931921 RepID=A0A9X7Z976_9BACL|nr:ABC transporter permease [Alicyclobacillus mengziensis]QSO49323.1 ABC transporter permease [Alicyclobacillus mengziensis]